MSSSGTQEENRAAGPLHLKAVWLGCVHDEACCACELDVDVLQNMGGLEDSPSYWQLH